MTHVACGWHHTNLVSDSNKLFTFEWSKYSQLGHGDFQGHLIPHQVKALGKTKVQSAQFWTSEFQKQNSKIKIPNSPIPNSKFTNLISLPLIQNVFTLINNNCWSNP
jgi:hypothetical protein